MGRTLNLKLFVSQPRGCTRKAHPLGRRRGEVIRQGVACEVEPEVIPRGDPLR